MIELPPHALKTLAPRDAEVAGGGQLQRLVRRLLLRGSARRVVLSERVAVGPILNLVGRAVEEWVNQSRRQVVCGID